VESDDATWLGARDALEREGIAVVGYGGLGFMAIYVHPEDFARAKEIVRIDAERRKYWVDWWDVPPSPSNPSRP
jgi:hypothetical protein